MNSSNTHTIQIEGLPEGWEPVAYRVPVKDVDMILDRSGNVNNCTWNGETAYIIVQKTKPRRIVLEETEEMRQVHKGEYYFDPLLNKVVVWLGAYKKVSDHEYKIWRIKEE